MHYGPSMMLSSWRELSFLYSTGEKLVQRDTCKNALHNCIEVYKCFKKLKYKAFTVIVEVNMLCI